ARAAPWRTSRATKDGRDSRARSELAPSIVHARPRTRRGAAAGTNNEWWRAVLHGAGPASIAQADPDVPVERARAALGRARIHAQVQRGLDQLELHEQETPAGTAHEVAARVHGPRADEGQHALGGADGAGLRDDGGDARTVLLLDAEIAAPGDLADGMAELAAEIEQRELPVRFDGLQVRLHDERPFAENRGETLSGGVGFFAGQEERVRRVRAHHRFHDDAGGIERLRRTLHGRGVVALEPA